MPHVDALTFLAFSVLTIACVVWSWWAVSYIQGLETENQILEKENKALHEEVCRLAINHSLD